MTQMIDFILHIDKHLIDLIANYGIWIYAILFLIIFAETGFVVTPFLPGDSLLFAAGGMAAIGNLALLNLMVSLSIAAILGNVVNYAVGYYLGQQILDKGWIKKSYLDQTEAYFKKHGAQTIIFSRFAPILRTVAPFVAGVGRMDYKKFILFNIAGALCWVVLCLSAGYFLFNIPAVKNNFSLITLGIIAVSFIPALLAFLRANKKKS
jgi:membrane-associated protein